MATEAIQKQVSLNYLATFAAANPGPALPNVDEVVENTVYVLRR